ncbi:protein-tyrosine phosphatase-like protein [Mycena galopus ATCC 62051]|nr:protein-tyrosine phosphatase-like protein [Mycena galopus ATCC 62051]
MESIVTQLLPAWPSENTSSERTMDSNSWRGTRLKNFRIWEMTMWFIKGADHDVQLGGVRVSSPRLGLHVNTPLATQLHPPTTHTMIAFDSLSREEMEAMCTPMHLVLSPTPCSSATNTRAKNNSAVAAATPHDGLGPTPVPGPEADGAATTTGALYLGSMAAAHDMDLLRAHDIAHLVQVLEVPWMPDSDRPGLSCHRVDLQDTVSASLLPHLEAACDYIRVSLSRRENVLVHCQQGVSRSASIVIAYLIRDRAMTYDAAFDLVRQRRQCIHPNSGFVKTLREWETTCNASQLQYKTISRPASA